MQLNGKKIMLEIDSVRFSQNPNLGFTDIALEPTPYNRGMSLSNRLSTPTPLPRTAFVTQRAVRHGGRRQTHEIDFCSSMAVRMRKCLVKSKAAIQSPWLPLGRRAPAGAWWRSGVVLCGGCGGVWAGGVVFACMCVCVCARVCCQVAIQSRRLIRNSPKSVRGSIFLRNGLSSVAEPS